jgi:hypothetical protein
LNVPSARRGRRRAALRSLLAVLERVRAFPPPRIEQLTM